MKNISFNFKQFSLLFSFDNFLILEDKYSSPLYIISIFANIPSKKFRILFKDFKIYLQSDHVIINFNQIK